MNINFFKFAIFNQSVAKSKHFKDLKRLTYKKTRQNTLRGDL